MKKINKELMEEIKEAAMSDIRSDYFAQNKSIFYNDQHGNLIEEFPDGSIRTYKTDYEEN